jgi:hypothetical protein
LLGCLSQLHALCSQLLHQGSFFIELGLHGVEPQLNSCIILLHLLLLYLRGLALAHHCRRHHDTLFHFVLDLHVSFDLLLLQIREI